MDGMNFVRVRYGATELRFLIDSGANISVIFSNYVNKSEIINTLNRAKINGISGYTYSLGSANIKFILNNKQITHEFFIVENSNINVHGVLGSDFFLKHGAVIDYEKFAFSFWLGNEKVIVPLESEYDHYISLPSRCEVITYCDYNEIGDYVVRPEELCEGVFVAGIIGKIKGNKIPVRLLNVNDREIKIRNFKPKLEPLTNFNFFQFDCNKLSVERVDRVLDLINTKTLNDEQKTSIEKICAKYADVFHLENDPLTVTNVYKQKIYLKEDATPVYVKPYRLPHAQKKEIHRQIDSMLESGIIEEAKCEWASPILLVPKRADSNGQKKWRVVIDYRQLNKQIKDEKFPLPCITDILDSLSGAIYFSHLDLSQGYYQVELDPESRPCTAFTTDRGQFQMKRLPMGLKISPNVFSRLVTIAMAGLNYDVCFIYLDDLIVVGNSLQTHNKNLIKVLQRLREVNLKLNPQKCEFLKQQLLYLGHVISADGISPDPEKTKVISEYPVPKNADEAKRFVAFANYYRKFIPDFAKIAQPLNDLSRKGTIFNWSNECQQAFEELKKALVDSKLLEFPNFTGNNTFILKTDASGYALGAVLSNSNNKPVAFASRSLNKAERNYCTIEKELLAIVWGVKHFRPYLYGKKFHIISDHKPLLALFGMKNPSSRLTKFRLTLEEYDFTISYIKGSENVTADALSRIILDSDNLKSMCEREIGCVNVLTRAQTRKNYETDIPAPHNSFNDRTDHPGIVEILKRPVDSVEVCPVLYEKFKELVSTKNHGINSKKFNNFIYDENKAIIYFNQEYRSTLSLRESLRDLGKICKKHKIVELCILKNKQNEKFLKDIGKLKHEILESAIKICVIKDLQKIEDKELQQLILNDYHTLCTGGHAGVNRMYNNIKTRYFWSGLKKDVQKFVKRCDDCQRYKYSKPNKEPMTITTTANTAFQKVFLDLVGPLGVDVNNNRYILTLQCELSKFVEAYPLVNKEANTVAKSFVDNFILRYGLPEQVCTDRGSEFLASTFQETCKMLGVKQLISTAYHHETLGALENSHKHLGAYMRIQVAKEPHNWSSWVPYWCFAYNNSVHSETRYTPYELVFGKLCQTPANFISQVEPLYNFNDYPNELKYRLQRACTEARENLIYSKEKRKLTFDKKSNHISYKIGDKVLVKNNAMECKLDAIYKGPYKVIRDLGSNVILKVENKTVEVHKDRVKLYYP